LSQAGVTGFYYQLLPLWVLAYSAAVLDKFLLRLQPAAASGEQDDQGLGLSTRWG